MSPLLGCSSSRRDVLRTGGLVALAGLSGCLGSGNPPAPRSPDPGSWPLEAYDTRNTRWNPHASPPTDPDVEWRTGDSTAEFWTLVVADGAVFVGGTSVRAYETDGSLRWKLNRSADTMGVTGGTLYVADNADGVAALSPEDGSAAWVSDFDRVVDGILPTTDRVFVAFHDRLVCLDAETGETRWAQWGQGGAGPTGFAVGDALYTTDVGSAARRTPHGFVERFRDRPPGVDWEATRELDFPHAPVLAGETLFVPDESFAGSGTGGIAAFDAEDGSFRWNRNLGGRAYAPALADESRDVLLVGTRQAEGERYELVALDRHDGSVRWRVRPDHWVGSLAVVDGTVVTGGGNADGGVTGAISAYSLDGRREWTVETGGDVTAVAPVGDRVYASSRVGEVIAVGDAE